MNNNLHAAMLVAAMSLGTILLRFLPFAIFSGKRETPKIILYLGDVLPSAALGMLVIYCLRDINLFAASFGLPELAASAIVVLVQVFRRNTILSILAGTSFYMLLLHMI